MVRLPGLWGEIPLLGDCPLSGLTPTCPLQGGHREGDQECPELPSTGATPGSRQRPCPRGPVLCGCSKEEDGGEWERPRQGGRLGSRTEGLVGLAGAEGPCHGPVRPLKMSRRPPLRPPGCTPACALHPARARWAVTRPLQAPVSCCWAGRPWLLPPGQRPCTEASPGPAGAARRDARGSFR